MISDLAIIFHVNADRRSTILIGDVTKYFTKATPKGRAERKAPYTSKVFTGLGSAVPAVVCDP